jgi:hypothetical protein
VILKGQNNARLEDVLVWMKENTVTEDEVAILTDSLSIQETTERNPGETASTPGHFGITSNERANKLAGGAESVGGPNMDT